MFRSIPNKSKDPLFISVHKVFSNLTENVWKIDNEILISSVNLENTFKEITEHQWSLMVEVTVDVTLVKTLDGFR